MTGLLSIVAVQLLRMRHLAEQSPERAANEVVSAEWVTTLTKVQQRPSPKARSMPKP
ncbi:MAG: hypothetical protein R3C01_02680 [Planctomycetaceae bacterium]